MKRKGKKKKTRKTKETKNKRNPTDGTATSSSRAPSEALVRCQCLNGGKSKRTSPLPAPLDQENDAGRKKDGRADAGAHEEDDKEAVVVLSDARAHHRTVVVESLHNG
jgi:hypothetical protein